MPWQLVLRDAEHRGSHVLDRPRTVVGADDRCDVRLSDLTVSRRHAVLVIDGDRLTVEDLGSRNGTRVGGVRIDGPTPLPDGAQLAFGSVAATVHAVAEKDALPAVRFDAPEPAVADAQPPPGPAPTTMASGSLHELLTRGLPGLLRDLADGCGLAELAPRVGRVVLDALPARRVAIRRVDREGERGVLFVGAAVPAAVFAGGDRAGGSSGAGARLRRSADPIDTVSRTSASPSGRLADPADQEGAGDRERREVVSVAQETAAGGTTVEARRGDLVVEVVFAMPSQARGYRPLVEALADLLRAARGAPKAPRSIDLGDDPPLPSPPTLDPALRRIYEEARRVAAGDVSVLIRGESGTGKEILARYLHAASARRNETFVALNCAALPRDLLESELFGVEAGVATGVRPRPGKFELADGGTLFLDEIGDMAPETQARILRVLQEGEVYRLGGVEPRSARVRILAATNRDLDALRRDGGFRDDLYHRIADWVVELPPLRTRRCDVPNLAAFFLLRECERRGVRAAGISEAAIESLQAYAWPGNVRQLEREMARVALFLESGEMLQLRHLQPEIAGNGDGTAVAAPTGSLQQVVEEAERRAIADALRREDGNMTAAAKALGIGRTTLYRRVKELGLGLPASGPRTGC